jgi:exodeoxyribonuclease VII large subunit
VIARLQQRLDLAARGLLSPEQRIQRERALLNQYAARLTRGLQWAYGGQRQRFLQQRSRFFASAPDVRQHRDALKSVMASLARAAATAMSTRRTALTQHAQALSLLNPEQVLHRGYAMVTRAQPGAGVVTSREQLKSTDRVTLRFYDGQADAEIK